MKSYSETLHIQQLEKRKGGYYFIPVIADVVNQFSRKKATRVICSLDNTVSYRCGFNHLGDGNFYIIIASRYLNQLGKNLGDEVLFSIEEDPDPLGVDIPEVLTVLLDQDPEAGNIFKQLTDGKKRSLIYGLVKIKNIDKQVKFILEVLEKEARKLKPQ